MPAFDTSVLVPLFTPGHPHHERSVAAFNDADQVLLHPCVLAETTTVLRRLVKGAAGDGDAAGRQAIQALLEQPRCRLVADLDYPRAVARYGASPSLSLTDAIVLQLGQEHDRRPPVTFDANVRAAVEAMRRA